MFQNSVYSSLSGIISHKVTTQNIFSKKQFG